LAAKGRLDPDGGWRMPQAIFVAAWVVLAATWSTPAVGLLAVPLALFRRLRPWLWLLVVATHLVLLVGGNLPGGSAAMLLWYAFTFDPAWVKPFPAAGKETVFYDGACGLCHTFVRFVLAEDRNAVFDLAPLESEYFQSRVPATSRATVVETVVVETSAGTLLTRSRAARHVLARLGGSWRLLAALLGLVPSNHLDVAYDFVARTRRSLFPAPESACPVLPPHLAARFRA
jgi:predicted DCC family thiol-disulfide oxidoreductase YuxK